MAKTLHEGDRVRIVDREVTPEDVKSGLFYNHFRGLVGTIQKIYDEKEAAVVIEVESMPESQGFITSIFFWTKNIKYRYAYLFMMK